MGIAAYSDDYAVSPTLGTNNADAPARVTTAAGAPPDAATVIRQSSNRVAARGNALPAQTVACGIFDPAIDAANQPLTTDLRLVSEIHAGLTRIGQADAGDYSVTRGLTSGWASANAATKYEFALRPGLRFSDGSPLLAADVKWSWERALRKSVPGCRARSALGGIMGANDVATMASQDLAGVSVIDDRTLVITLARPEIDFPLALTDRVAAVLKRDDVAAWDDAWTINPELPAVGYREQELPPSVLPAGAGPFRLVGYSRLAASDLAPASGSDCVLHRNTHSWDQPHPRIDAVVASIAFDDLQGPVDAPVRDIPPE